MTPERLKDIFFTNEFVLGLARRLGEECPSFDAPEFTQRVLCPEWPEMALKEKMRHVTRCLHAALPAEYPTTLAILRKVEPEFHGFDVMVFPDFVQCYGLDDWDISMPALEQFTKNCSSEFAIRAFLAADAPRAMEWVARWAESPDPRVRRLASEGSRPRLPWGMGLPAFKKNAGPILPILERLKDDPSEDVRRSVSNSLNDISKDHPELALEICERWIGKSAQVDRLVKHACRDMLKKGNPRALALFGFDRSAAGSTPKGAASLSVENACIDPPSVAIGEKVRLAYDLLVEAQEPVNVRLEYAVEYVRPSGKPSRKVFRLREAVFAPGRHAVQKNHSFMDQSTRKHYPGQHWFEVLVNGEKQARTSMELRESE